MTTNSNPTALGLRKTFGFGDRLGLAGPGHIAAVRGSSFAPILAQQSIRELTRTQRTPDEVLNAARHAVATTGYEGAWGADADHMKTTADAARMVQAGFTFFTIDPSEHVDNRADTLPTPALRDLLEANRASTPGGVSAPEVDAYLHRDYDIGTRSLRFDEHALLSAAVKYGRAIAHTEVMARQIAQSAAGRPVEIEVSIDETDSITSPLDHLYVALELQRRGVKPVSVAPRFIGSFEKGVDYKGDIARFETDLAEHAAIAAAYGPYKISIHSGSDKFSIYPAIGRICGERLHIKTAGTNYLEALRVVCRTQPALFASIARYSMQRFPSDKASYHISVTDAWVRDLQVREDPTWLERTFLDEAHGRQVLHVTFGSVLTHGQTPGGRPFKPAILETLEQHSDLHAELLIKHLGHHIRELERG